DVAMDRLYGSIREPLLPMLAPARRATIRFPTEFATFDGEPCPAWAQIGDLHNRMAVHVPGPAAVHCQLHVGHGGLHVAVDRATIVPLRKFRAWVWEDEHPVAPPFMPLGGYGRGRRVLPTLMPRRRATVTPKRRRRRRG